MDLRLAFHLGQMESGSNISLFSKLQVSIFKARIDGSSCTSIRKIFKICNGESQFLDSHGIKPAKAVDQRIYPASIKCNFKGFYPDNPIREFNN
jgi:hypothetical protein